MAVDGRFMLHHPGLFGAVDHAHDIHIPELRTALTPVAMGHAVVAADFGAGFNLAAFRHRPMEQPVKPGDPLAGGGALLDLTVYPSTWALGSLGFPTSVAAEGTLNDDGVDAQNALTLTYASGAQAQLSSSLLASGPSQATVAGSKGWLRTSAPLHNPRELYVHPHGGEARVEKFEQAGNGYAYELRETTRCIQEGLLESPTMPLQHTLDTMRMFDGVRAQLGLRYANDDR